MKLLLRHLSPAEAEAETTSGNTALHFAVAALLREGAGRWGEGPSQRAEVEGCAAWAIVQELVRHGLCLKVKNCQGISPLTMPSKVRVVENTLQVLRVRLQQMPH